MDTNRLPTGSHNFPSPLIPLIGRRDELAEIARLLDDPDCRLLTLVGPGGIGKTRLALEAARLQQDNFAQGVTLVSLQPLGSPEFIVSAIAEALRFQFYSVDDPKHQLLDYLRERSLLLVMDNFEHLLDSAVLVSEILASAPDVTVLATSRERLNLLEEWVLDVQGLSAPASEAETEIDDYDAVRLFLQSAQRIQVGFTLTDAQKPAVARICRLVGGMPLGIELAAVWVRTLSCEEIAAEIERSLDILATSARNVEPRHRTMRAVLDHSWNLLADTERDVFQKLSVFRGGFRKETAQNVAGTSLQTLSTLVDKSLLRVEANGRYDLHELLRQYAFEKLAEANEANTILNRHRDYFLTLAESAEPELFSVNQIDWLNRLDTELGNIRAAIVWSLEGGEIEASLRLMSSLHYLWALHGYHHEGYRHLVDMLSLPAARNRTTVRAKALNAAGIIQWFEGHNSESRLLLEEAVAIAREVGDLRQLGLAVRTLGPVLYGLGEYEAARSSLEESLLIARNLQDNYGIAWSLLFLGDLALKAESTGQAQKLYHESMDMLRKLGDTALLAYTVRRLGFVLRGYQDYEHAKALCQESLELNFATGDRRAVAASLVGLAGLAVEQGQAIRAAQLLGAADRLLNDIAAHMLFDDQLEYERHLTSVRSQLDTPTFNQAWAEGQSMTIEHAVAYALDNRNPPIAVVQPDNQPLPDSLTARELEILHLMAQGMSNRDIAEKLILSVGTVKWYGSQICGKLHAQNRVQAIARARELKILL